MMLSKKTISEFISILGSETPVPGGGSASALSGALGVALIAMVANLTVGRQKYSECEELNRFALEESNKLCAELIALIDRDAEAYGKLAEAYKLPRGTAKEKTARNAAIAETTLGATEAPFETMQAALKALYLCKSLVGKSNENAASDLGVSALNLLSCINGAWLNVLINLSGVENATTAEFFKTKGQEIVDTAKKEAEYIYDTVRDLMQ